MLVNNQTYKISVPMSSNKLGICQMLNLNVSNLFDFSVTNYMHSFYFDQLPDQFGKYFAEPSLIHNH